MQVQARKRIEVAMQDDLLPKAINLARSGQKEEARLLLVRILSANPHSEIAWLWLVECTQEHEERIRVLESCLRVVPQSEKARVGLAALRSKSQPAPEPAPPPPVEPSEEPDEEPAADPLTDESQSEPAKNPFLNEQPLENAPEAAAQNQGEPGSVFTVLPEEISPEEFAQIEARTEAVLQSKPVIRPLKIQQAVDNRTGPKKNAKTRRKQPPKSQLTPSRLALLIILTGLGLTGIIILVTGMMRLMGQ
jgi:hypothetical protein